MRKSFISTAVALAIAVPLTASAIGPDVTLDWLAANQSATVDFKARKKHY